MSLQDSHTGTVSASGTAIEAGRDSVRAEPLGRLARRLYAAQCRSKHRAVHSKLHKNLRMRFPLFNNLQRLLTFAHRHAGKARVILGAVE